MHYLNQALKSSRKNRVYQRHIRTWQSKSRKPTGNRPHPNDTMKSAPRTVVDGEDTHMAPLRSQSKT